MRSLTGIALLSLNSLVGTAVEPSASAKLNPSRPGFKVIMQPFLIAVSKTTGETVWQHDEPINREGTPEAKFSNADYYGSWSTPLLREIDGRTELIVRFPFRVCSFDPGTGKELWTSTGINALVYTSPIFADGIIVTMGGFGGMTIALKTGGRGDVTKENRLWRHARMKQRIGSAAIHAGLIFVHSDPGIAEYFDLPTGRLIWEQQLTGQSARGTNWSSVMIADGLCYTLTQGGKCFVFRAGPQFELVATNSLDEHPNPSIVPSDGQLFLRTSNTCGVSERSDPPSTTKPLQPNCSHAVSILSSVISGRQRPGLPEDEVGSAPVTSQATNKYKSAKQVRIVTSRQVSYPEQGIACGEIDPCASLGGP